jgi:zinc protease
VIGHTDALRRLRVEEMRDYHARFYHPGNATLVMCGDLDTNDALARARAHFEAIPAGMPYEQADCFRATEETPAGERRVRMTWDDQGKRLCIGWPTAAVGTSDDWTLDVVSTLLTGGRTSRLHRRLVIEEELATSISTQSDTRVDSGVFWLFAECASSADPAKLEAAIDEELDKIARAPVTKSELARVRSMLAATEAYDEETASDLAEQLGEFATDADWRLAVRGLQHVLAVDAKQVRDCAARLLTRERRVVGWCLPKEPKAAARKTPAKRARAGAKR